MLWFMRFGVYILVASLGRPTVRAMSYLETNEVTNKVDESVFQPPMCTPDSVCGFLQVNARGISNKLLCQCPDNVQCPLTWDIQDGHSVTQGSDQYKFCGKAPKPKVCNHQETAYTSKILYSKSTQQTFSQTERVHCICAAEHNYVMAHQHFWEPDADTEAVAVSYTCNLLPRCEVGDSCKAVSQSGPEFFVNSKCLCPPNLRCPTLGNEALHSLDTGHGRVDMLRCQPFTIKK